MGDNSSIGAAVAVAIAESSHSSADDMTAISKIESGQEDSRDTPSSIESTPEPGADTAPIDQTQPQKRKGGRKPIYATSEERKQRNRQAQAAFRERRTEYIKQLEATIKQHEDALQSLQQSHRSAADECLMLRYKNSLLERILLEKGIDVQAELQVKTGSPALGPTHVSHHISNSAVQPPLQRTAVNRQHARRSLQGMPPRAPSGGAMGQPISHEHPYSARSPQQPTPSSHASSPTALSINSSGSVAQGGMTPPTSAGMAPGPLQQQHRPSQQQLRNHYMMQQPSQRQMTTAQYPGSSGMSSVSTASSQTGGGQGGTGTAAASAYYPSPFQKHIDQLEQEYDAPPHTMTDMDQEAHDQRSFGTAVTPDQYREQYSGMSQPTMQHMQVQNKITTPDNAVQQQVDPSGQYPPINQVYDHFDPMLDADPFGLTASMHFPTPYSYDQSQQR